jgi:fucose permease
MSKNPKVGIWFIATALTFFARALLFATWQSRSPEVKEYLELTTAQMGLVVMLFPLGGLIGIFFANGMHRRFGAGALTIASFTIGSLSMVGLAFSIPAGDLWISCLLILAMGLPMALMDFISNYEGTEVDKQAKRSLLPIIHSTFGVGMMVAAGLSGWMLGNNLSLTFNYILIAAIVLGSAVWAGFNLPKRQLFQLDTEKVRENKAVARSVWREPRTLVVALIGLSFIIAELSAGTWLPIALENAGFTPADAANAFGLFWVVITATRVLGGFVVDFLGRFRTILLSTLVTSSGIAVFIFDSVLAQPYLGIVLWGAGLALGFPMAGNALSDDPARSPARINLMITLVYFSSVSVGPALGALGQEFGLYVAFTVPLVLMLGSAILSPATKRAN